ncbi:hypothetical protein DIPPA_16047 [Diplonema papillatum]|nr:hypothetical protein DIPPA_16047 [Diplonema papillatum]
MAEEDPLAGVKRDLDARMNSAPYSTNSCDYIGREWQACEIVSGMAFGKDQKYSGLSRSGAPHGWGVLEHHMGLIHSCAMWKDGVADGRGVLTTPETVHYGSWHDGNRVGFFAFVKQGGIFVEEYSAAGELMRRIKWKRDRLHKQCTRCQRLYTEGANTETAPMCRYHPDPPDHNGTFTCCGAMSVYNPLGCALTVHTLA